MRATRASKTFPIGMMIFVFALANYKAAMLAASMVLDWRAFLFLVGLDGLYLAVVLLFGILHGYAKQRSLRNFIRLLLIFMTVMYLVDSFVLLALNEHAPLFDIGRFAFEPYVVLSFFDMKVYMAIVLLLVSMFFWSAFRYSTRRLSWSLLLLVIVVGGLCTTYAPLPLTRYAMLNPVMVWTVFKPQAVARAYSDEEIRFYATQPVEISHVPNSKPDIILLIVESLSSINSTRVSGTEGFLDGFDRLSEEGVLFRNFFANHQASEGGLISLLGGHPPMHFPNATPYMFDEFAIQASIIAEYQRQGYFTEFLTNANLGFIGLDRYLNGLGLDRSRGRDEVESMKNAPVVVQDAPSDEVLFDEANRTITELLSKQTPFLLTIATTSTHLPYIHPDGGPDTAEAVWDWSMQQVNGFYEQLSENGFFDNGLLLITGDHRQMRPLSEPEMTRYGDSARARIPLLVIGEGYAAGSIDDRFFQQSDLLRSLSKINQPSVPLSPQPIWVERYNRKYGRVELINNLSIFDETDSGRHEYRLKVPGNSIEWLGEKPAFAHRIETRIHTQRSLHQNARLILN